MDALSACLSCLRIEPEDEADSERGPLLNQEQAHSIRRHGTHHRRVYFIRHAEKPSQGNGLNAQGVERSKWLKKLFGPRSDYGINYLIAQRPKADGKQRRPFDTLHPLAEKLGLKVDIDCDRDDFKNVVAKIRGYKGEGNILICWEHKRLTDLAAALGVKQPPAYPTKRFDIIWICVEPYHKISTSQQMCPGLDID